MTAPTAPVTGPQFSLVAGDARAEIGALAAVLRTLVVDGDIHLTEPFGTDTLPPFGDGIVLAPWPNRVKDAVWVHDGADQRLNVTEVARGNALHGLLRDTEYRVLEQSPSSVTLGATIHQQHGWPFQLETTVRYDLAEDGITVTQEAVNVGAQRAPWATGSHPFLRVGDAPLETTTLTVPAATYFEVDERLNPLAESPVDGTSSDLRTPRPVGELRLDTAYGTVTHAEVVDGAGAAAWLETPDGSRTTLWQDVDWDYVQVFTTPIFPKADGLGLAVAVEPMTAPPNALNSGQALIWIAPGERWTGRWGIRYTPGE